MQIPQEDLLINGDDGDVELDDQELEAAEPLDIAVEDRRLVTQPYDLSISTLIEDIDQGRLLLELEYQRDYVWDEAKASRLIESLLLNIPIPVCYFAENPDGTQEVVDGQQRLKSIWRFASEAVTPDEQLTLRGLPVITEANGSKFGELSQRDQRRLLSRTIRCVVITEDSHPDIKFDVFERLNTGAVKLTDQELRNSIYRGALNDALKEAAAAPALQGVLDGQLVRRKGDVELVLRFCALADRLTAYKPPLRQFLNEYMRDHQHEFDQALIARFQEVISVVADVLEQRAFRRFNQAGNAGRQINKALFDAEMLSFHYADLDAIQTQRDGVVESLNAVLDDEGFEPLIGRATADRTRMFGRIRRVSEALAGIGIASTYAEALPDEAE